MDGLNHTHIIGERDEINGVQFENFLIPGRHGNFKAFVRPFLFNPARIFAAHLHVGIQGIHPVVFLRQIDILGIARFRIGHRFGYHAADLKLRVDLTGEFRRQRGSDQLMMQRLVNGFLGLQLGWIILFDDPDGRKRMTEHRIDFIKRQPVFHQILIPVEANLGIADKMIDDLARRPAFAMGHEIQRHFVVRQRD